MMKGDLGRWVHGKVGPSVLSYACEGEELGFTRVTRMWRNCPKSRWKMQGLKVQEPYT
jgi:hypothetical protein